MHSGTMACWACCRRQHQVRPNHLLGYDWIRHRYGTVVTCPMLRVRPTSHHTRCIALLLSHLFPRLDFSSTSGVACPAIKSNRRICSDRGRGCPTCRGGGVILGFSRLAGYCTRVCNIPQVAWILESLAGIRKQGSPTPPSGLVPRYGACRRFISGDIRDARTARRFSRAWACVAGWHLPK